MTFGMKTKTFLNDFFCDVLRVTPDLAFKEFRDEFMYNIWLIFISMQLWVNTQI
jgi:hypothetical protein